MVNWIPAAAVVGLLALMIIPAPGIWGVLIGGACSLAIIVSAIAWLFDRVATRFLARREQVRAKRLAKLRRSVHAGPGADPQGLIGREPPRRRQNRPTTPHSDTHPARRQACGPDVRPAFSRGS